MFCRLIGSLMRQKLQTLNIACKLFNHWLLPLYTTFIDFHLAWGHKVKANQNLLASFSHTLFNWPGWNFIWHWSNSSWTIQYCFWVRFSLAAVLQCERNVSLACILTFVSQFGANIDDRFYWTLHFDTSVADLDFDSRSQECKKAK